MTPAVKQWMKKFYRNGSNVPYRAVSSVHFNINSRATIAKAIQERAVNGMIGSIASGCTCDGLSYSNSVLTRVPNVFQECSYREKEYENADGPVNFYFCKPKDLPEDARISRDLHAEAAGY